LLLNSENPNAPIGVFDSGIGGLSVLRHLRESLPSEHFLYVADSGHAPYGKRSPGYVRDRALAIGDFLRGHGAKALVVACNTATAAAVEALRSRHPWPVIAMEPGIKPAVAATRRRLVGVLATAGTLESARFYALVNRFAGDVEIVTQPCPGLVELVERGDHAGAEARTLVERYLTPLLRRGADVIVLGCTHYPFLRALIEELAGPAVHIVDTGPAVAREVRRRLQDEGLLRSGGQGEARFWTSGEQRMLSAALERLWGFRDGAEALSVG
jgi:glutamate racemase